MGGLPTNGLAVHPENSRVMMYAAMRDGLFRSVDAGESWKPVGKDLKNIAAAAVNPRWPEEVYASTEDGTIYRSTDGGSAWMAGR